MSWVSGPYQVDESVLESHETLDATDLGAWFLVVQGSLVFFETEKRAIETRKSLNTHE